MTKSQKESSKKPSELPLFEWVKKAQEITSQTQFPPQGSLDIDAELRAAISADIKACPFSRYQVAARISELVGREVTAAMLNNWTAESHENHNFPCQYLPAFVIATGGQSAFECLSRRAGLFALPGPEALLSEVGKIREEIKRLKNEEKKRMMLVKEMKG